ncbi:MAG: hypothetical protein IJW40_01070 [Clostridia bacterium]|nr:hypothetical protein [Clostridia bacterium]
MKENKKTALRSVLVLMVLCITLTGCAEISVDFAEFDPKEVVSVQLYYVPHGIDYSMGESIVDYSPIAMLEERRNADFLEDLSRVEFTYFAIFIPVAIDPSFYMGEWIIRLNMHDGTNWAISKWGYNLQFDAENEVIDGNHDSPDDQQWEVLIRKYFPKEYIMSIITVPSADHGNCCDADTFLRNIQTRST